MKPTKEGQIVKFHTPLPDEDTDQLYVVLEVKDDVEKPRVDIIILNGGQPFTPINTVLLDDLAVVEVFTDDLLGHIVTINKTDLSQVSGKVIHVRDKKIKLDLIKSAKGIETNVWLTVKDDKNNEQSGTLFVQ